MKRRKQYDVLVEIYQGVLQGVRILSHEKAIQVWHEWCKKEGYKDYDDFLRHLRDSEVDEELRWFVDISLEDGFEFESINPSRREQY